MGKEIKNETEQDDQSILTIKSIVLGWLATNNYDGLYRTYPGHCQCELSELMRCADPSMSNCKAGRKVPCDCVVCGSLFHIKLDTEDEK